LAAAQGLGMKALLFIAFTSTFTAASAAQAAPPPAGEWNFRALLDGKLIGEHHFSVSTEGDERKVTSEANFAIKFFGITAYRYRHKATEQWRGDCLTALASTTDDDGKANKVRAESGGGSLDIVSGNQTPQSLKGCVMSFAYWNPAIQMQSRLLDPQTGKLETVQVSRIGSGSVEVRGQPVAATQFRITGPVAPIDVWYSAQGEWLGLDSIVAGGRKLSYRLQ
jgi:Family of unknown function (DUF6134)